MNILILGGTIFLGRHTVESALARGHDVALFNRCRTSPALFPGVERLRGDRDGDLAALRGRRFDAVIDSSGYTPDQLRAAGQVLGDAVDHYVFVSSISAYRVFPPGRPYDEAASLLEGDEGYGALKARAEEAIEAAMPGRVARVRPGLIVGPHDPTDRFTYWPRRVARGGEVLAPGRRARPVQFVDARDLAAWLVRLAEHKRAGAFNAVGPSRTLTMEQLLLACRDSTGSDARFTWIDDAVLLGLGAQPWTELPLWIPESDEKSGGMLLADNRSALAAGLALRPLAQTISDTLAWDRLANSASGQGRAGRAQPITPQREAALLAHRTQSTGEPPVSTETAHGP